MACGCGHYRGDSRGYQSLDVATALNALSPSNKKPPTYGGKARGGGQNSNVSETPQSVDADWGLSEVFSIMEGHLSDEIITYLSFNPI